MSRLFFRDTALNTGEHNKSQRLYKEDQTLVKRLMSGDETAFDAFFRQYYPRVYRFCRRRLAESDAEDVAMDAMRQALRRIETYRGEAMLITWLYQVARSQVSAFYKREKKHQHLILIEDDDQVRAEVDAMASQVDRTPEAVYDAEQRRHLIHFMLDSLPGVYGQVLQWKYIEGYSVDEIAGKLTTTPAAIQSMLARARGAFRKAHKDISERFDQSGPTPLFAIE